MGWLPIVTIFELIFPTLVRAFYSRVTYGLGGPILSTVREVEIRLSPESIYCILDIPSVGLRVYEAKAWPIVPGFEPREAIQRLCGLVDAQGMANHWHTAWPCPTESIITWSTPSYCHEVDIKTRSPTSRHSLWTRFWQGDWFTWGIWWWCIWYLALRAWLEYSPTTASLLEYSRMSGSIWAERRTSRPLLAMTLMMSSPWGEWSSRRHPRTLGLGELSDLQHRPEDRDRCIPE